MAHVAAWKKDELQELEALLKTRPVIGIVDISGIAARQLQAMRREFNGKIQIRTARNTLLRLALDNAEDENLRKLADYVQSGSSLALTDVNPFVIYKPFEKGKTSAPAKGGEVCPKDVVISKGDTGFPPGPLVGEMQMVGIPAAIESGKIVVKKDYTLLKAGDEISPAVAKILSKLEIEPLEVGLNLFAVYENGFVFEASSLAIDEELIASQFGQAYTQSFNLAVNAAIPNAKTINILLGLAYSNARNLSVNAGIINSESLPLILGKAYVEMLAVAKIAGTGAIDEELENLLGAAAAAAAAVSAPAAKNDEAPAEEEEEEEEASEEDALEGLGALFG